MKILAVKFSRKIHAYKIFLLWNNIHIWIYAMIFQSRILNAKKGQQKFQKLKEWKKYWTKQNTSGLVSSKVLEQQLSLKQSCQFFLQMPIYNNVLK